jgi:hypothetical protein
MRGALLAANIAAWLHQLTAITAREDSLAGHGIGSAITAAQRTRARPA